MKIITKGKNVVVELFKHTPKVFENYADIHRVIDKKGEHDDSFKQQRSAKRCNDKNASSKGWWNRTKHRHKTKWRNCRQAGRWTPYSINRLWGCFNTTILSKQGIRIVSHTTIKPTGETPSGVTELAPTKPEVTVNTEPKVTVDDKHEETVDKEPTKTDLETTQQYAKAGGKKKVFGVN